MTKPKGKIRASSANRCPSCKVTFQLCFCPYIEKVDTLEAIDIVMHHREKHLTSNTANLAKLCLPNARIHMRGLPNNRLDISTIFLPDYTPIYLFPAEHAETLTFEWAEDLRHKTGKPIQLIVPDGSWRQAKKVLSREPALQGIPCVSLRNMPPSVYQLRHEHLENGMATFEAIAHALSIMNPPETRENIRKSLFKNFSMMVEQNLKIRAKITFSRESLTPRDAEIKSREIKES